MKAEKLLEKMLCDAVEEKRGWCIKFIPFLFNGFPDRIVLYPGARIDFIEMKAEGKKIGKRKGEKLQLWVHRKLKEFGFNVYVLNTTEKVNEYIKSL